MVAPLVVAAIGLAKQKLDEDQEQYAGMMRYQEAAKRAAYQQQADIMAMRAARAGDSGYMQRAMGSALNFPTYDPPKQDNSAALFRVAGALAAQGEADTDERKIAAASGGADYGGDGGGFRDIDNDRAPSFARHRGSYGGYW